MKHLFLLAAALLSLTGCSKNQPLEISTVKETPRTHQWYFFTDMGFEQTNLPQHSDISSLKPWTETLRASDGNSSLEDKGYLIVNRLGVIFFHDNNDPVLLQDFQLFSKNTASDLIFDSGTPYIFLTRNSFFNKEANLESGKTDATPDRPFLIKIDSSTRTFYPVITYGDLELAHGGEITGTRFDGKTFTSAVKTFSHNNTYFSYINYSALESLENLAPYTKPGKLSLTTTTEASYIKLNTPLRFSEAPKRLKSLLSSIPSEFNFAVECKNAGGISPRLYSTSLDGEGISMAQAILAPEWICAVFADGTLYFNGALQGRTVLNNGKNIALRLPKLPEGYKYSYFCISGNKLAVAWEESDFYKTGRSGFLVVDLGKVLYGDL